MTLHIGPRGPIHRSMPKLPTTSAMMPTPEIGRPDILLARAAEAELGGRRDDAIRLYQRVISIDPTLLHAINRLGAVSGEIGDLAMATRQFETSLRIDPSQPEAWFNLGIAQSKFGRPEQALTCFDRVIALSPLSGAGHLERATTLTRMGRYEEAEAAFEETVRLLPNDPLVAGHRGWALQWRGKYDRALGEFDRAIELRPDFAAARVSKAMLTMLLGDLPAGFALYEWRWRMPAWRDSPSKSEPLHPLWLGDSDLAGKTILIYQEQGLGDAIQFCRYATLAANAGARVIVQVQPELVRLMGTLEGVSRVISDHGPRPDHDLRCPMMSLPLAFGTRLETVPVSIPYLHADPSRVVAWKSRLPATGDARVGLVWAGSSRFGDVELMATDQRRSVRLTDLAPLASIEGCSFISLQLGPPAEQAKSPPEGMILHDQAGELTDFMETAALIETLDLVIGVDTAVVHLAGAMGKPVWMLNRFDTCWRWLLDREDTPWYPTMRLFRQPRPGDWASVVQSVTDALRAFVTT
jgi:tetratricopeptide (TPR) repeat protein